MSEDYKDEEVALQGAKLSAKCIQCGEHLEVACGPHGLYPRCFKCDCDSKPTLVGNVVVSRWANSHSWNAKEEIKKLRKTFEENNSLNHSFDDYIAEISTKEKPATPSAHKRKKENISEKKASKTKDNDTIVNIILNGLRSNLSTPFDTVTISKAFGLNAASVRIYLKSLRESGSLKVVDWKLETLGNSTIYYQVPESPLKELKTYESGTKGGKYLSLNEFIEKHEDVIKPSKRASFKQLVKNSEISYVPLFIRSGLTKGYSTSDLEKSAGIRKVSKPTKTQKSKKVGTIRKVTKVNISERKVKKSTSEKVVTSTPETLKKTKPNKSILSFVTSLFSRRNKKELTKV